LYRPWVVKFEVQSWVFKQEVVSFDEQDLEVLHKLIQLFSVFAAQMYGLLPDYVAVIDFAFLDGGF